MSSDLRDLGPKATTRHVSFPAQQHHDTSVITPPPSDVLDSVLCLAANISALPN